MKATERTISSGTAAYIEIISLLDAVYDSALAALRMSHTDRDAEEILDAEFSSQFEALEESLGRLLYREIRSNVADLSGRTI